MMIGTGDYLLFYVGKDGVGWRVGKTWYRLRPPWMPLLYSERYGHAVIWRLMGWRLARRLTGRPWHVEQPTTSGEVTK